MSPAPVRGNPKLGKVGSAAGGAPSGGYGMVIGLFLVGLVCFIAAGGLAAQSLATSANELARNTARGDFRAVLDQGVNYVYSEDGVRLGPLDVRIIGPNGNELPVQPSSDVITYNVDARSGRADLAFDIPSTDEYTIQVLGDVRNIAVGGKVAEKATTPSVLLLIAGAVAWMLALAKLIITAVRHAQWKARTVAAGRVGQVRDQLSEQVEGTEARPGLAARVQAQAQSAVDQARSRAETASSTFNQNWNNSSQQVGRPPVYSDASELAQGHLDDSMDRLQDTVASGELTNERVDRVAGRADGVLASVQERLERGESLRDIAMGARQDIAAGASQEAQLARQDASTVVEAARAQGQIHSETASQASAQVSQTFAQQASQAADAMHETVRAQATQAAAAVQDTARLQGQQAAAAVNETVDAVVPSWAASAPPAAVAATTGAAAATAAAAVAHGAPPTAPAPPVPAPPAPVAASAPASISEPVAGSRSVVDSASVAATPSVAGTGYLGSSEQGLSDLGAMEQGVSVRGAPAPDATVQGLVEVQGAGPSAGDGHLMEPMALQVRDLEVRKTPSMGARSTFAGDSPARASAPANPEVSSAQAPATQPPSGEALQTASPGLAPPPNYGAMRLDADSAPKPTSATEPVAGISEPVDFKVAGSPSLPNEPIGDS